MNTKLMINCVFCAMYCAAHSTKIYASSDEEFPPYTTDKYTYNKSVYLWKEEPQSLGAKIMSYFLESHKPEPSVVEKIVEYIQLHPTTQAPVNYINTPILVSDSTILHWFDTGLTRKKITQDLNHDIIVTTTETWETQNPSYITARNFLLCMFVFGAISVATYHVWLSIIIPLLDKEHPYHPYLVQWIEQYKKSKKNK